MFIVHQNSDLSCEWIEINSFGDVIATQCFSHLAECPSINQEDILVMLFPGQDVMVTEIELPKVRAAERARIAHFVLEEQLASDPESVYIAFGLQDSNHKTVVAILDRSYFEAQYDSVRTNNQHPKIATPDFLAIAWEPETWTVVICKNRALVRTGLQAGFAIDIDNLVFFLKQSLEKLPLLSHPKKIVLWQDAVVVSVAGLEQYQIPFEIRDAAFKNKWDAAGLLSQLNLLQGKYRPKVHASGFEKSWKICGAVALCWLVFLFFSQCVQWMYLRHEAVGLQAQVMQAYQSLFPGSNRVLEPHFRTESLLKRYGLASHGNVFLKLYRAVGKTLLNYPDIHVQSLAFQEGVMKLTLSASNAAMLTQWQHVLTDQKITVKQTMHKTDAGVVQAVVVVS